MTQEDKIALWGTIKTLYKELSQTKADRAALIQILREELRESEVLVMNRLEQFRQEDFYQRALRDADQILLPIEASIRRSTDKELLEQLARMPVSKLVN